MKRYTIGLLLLAATIFGCKKEPELSARTHLLLDKKWQLQALMQTYPGSPDFDFYAQTDACSKDDYRRFEAPHTTIYDEGPTKCRARDEQTQAGYWALGNGDTELTIIDNVVLSQTYTIVKLTDKTLIVKRVLPQSTGLDLTQIFTYGVIP